MSGYVARKYDNVDDIKIILSVLKMPTLENPEALDPMADDVYKDIYREDVKAYAKETVRSPRLPKSYTHLSWFSALKSCARK